MIAVNRSSTHTQFGSWVIEKGLRLIVQRALVPFQGHHIIRALINDLLRDVALAVERVNRYDGALQAQHSQQLWDRRDLVRFDIGSDLAEHQALLAAPGRNHVHG